MAVIWTKTLLFGFMLCVCIFITSIEHLHFLYYTVSIKFNWKHTESFSRNVFSSSNWVNTSDSPIFQADKWKSPRFIDNYNCNYNYNSCLQLPNSRWPQVAYPYNTKSVDTTEKTNKVHNHLMSLDVPQYSWNTDMKEPTLQSAMLSPFTCHVDHQCALECSQNQRLPAVMSSYWDLEESCLWIWNIHLGRGW